MRFYDDKNVTLDCGCTAHAGEDYYHYKFRVFSPMHNELRTISFTCCADTECFEKCINDYIPFKCETLHVDTKEDKEYQYGDLKYDDWR